MNIDRYLRKHWLNGEYDCWGLVRDFYEHEYKIVLPLIPLDATDITLVSNTIQHSDHRRLFQSIAEPVQGAVVEMEGKHKQLDKTLSRHVGIYIEPNNILHNNSIVRCFALPRIAVDWTIVGYYLHVSDCRIS